MKTFPHHIKISPFLARTTSLLSNLHHIFVQFFLSATIQLTEIRFQRKKHIC